MRTGLLTTALVAALVGLVAGGNQATAVRTAAPAASSAAVYASDGQAPAATRFMPVEVHIDPNGEPLAAYQFELQAEPSGVRIVGLEGGAHPALADPPYYDPEAMRGDRVIVAAFSTNAPADLPTQKTRVATIHVAVPVDAQPRFTIELQAAADGAGETVEATITTTMKEKADE